MGHHHPLTFNSEDELWQQSTFTKNDPLYPSSTKNYQVDSDNNNLGESNMIKENIIKNP